VYYHSCSVLNLRKLMGNKFSLQEKLWKTSLKISQALVFLLSKNVIAYIKENFQHVDLSKFFDVTGNILQATKGKVFNDLK